MSTTGIELGAVSRDKMGSCQRSPSGLFSEHVPDLARLSAASVENEQATGDVSDHSATELLASASPDSRSSAAVNLEAAIEKNRGLSLVQCLLHAIPLAITLMILSLNIRGIYWQDLGSPNQKQILQALQYAAKAYEIMTTASSSVIVAHYIRHDLTSSGGIPLGLLIGGYSLNQPLYFCKKQYLGPITERRHPNLLTRLHPLSLLTLVGGFLTLVVVGPSSAVTIIPRLDWWDVRQVDAFGNQYRDRVYFNRTEEELWPVNISNAIYANNPEDTCSAVNPNDDCAVRAMDSVGAWI